MATFWVDGVNGDDANGGTSEQDAKKTISAGAALLSGGDTLKILDDTYVFAWDLDADDVPNGSAGSHTIIEGESKTGTILQPSSGNFALRVANAQFITFKDLKLDGSNLDTGIENQGLNVKDTASDIRFERVWCFNCPDTGMFTQTDPTGLEFIDCESSDNGWFDNGQGLYLQASGALVQGGSYHDNASPGIWLHDGLGHLQNVTVERTSCFGNGESGIALNGSDCILRNNICYKNGQAGIDTGYNDGTGTSDDSNEIYNNTLVDNVGDGLQIGAFRSSDLNLIKNNIFKDNGGWGVKLESVADNNELDTNIFNGNTSGAVSDSGSGNTETGTLTSDPLFVDQANDDYHIQSGSPALAAGLTLSGFNNDFDNEIRPTNWSIGADDIEASAVATIQTSGNSGELASADPQTHSITISAGDNLALYVAVHVRVETVTSVDWNTSESLTELGSAISSTSNVNVFLYRLLSPTATTADITVNLSAARKAVISYWVVENVDQGNPEGTFQSAQNSSGTSNALTLGIPTDGLGIDAFTQETVASAHSADTGQTVVTNVEGSALDAQASHDSADNTGWSWSGDFTDWVHCGIAINPAAAGQTILVGLSSEADSGLATSRLKEQQTGLSQETDSSLASGIQKTASLGLAAETGSGLAVSSSKAKAVGLPVESDQSLAASAIRALGVGLASAADAALAVSGLKEQAVGLATETDSAFSVTFPSSGDFQVVHRSWTVPASGTSEVTLGFQMKAAILWAVNVQGVGSEQHYAPGFGVISDATKEMAVNAMSESGVTTSNSQRSTETRDAGTARSSLRLFDVATGSAEALEMFLDTVGATSVTFDYRNYVEGVQIHGLFFGGSDITNHKANSVVLNDATGLQSITDPGFQPDFVLVLFNNTGASGQNSHLQQSIGVATALGQWSVGVVSRNSLSASQTGRIQSLDRIITVPGLFEDVGTDVELTQMLSTGFELDINARDGASDEIYYLALKGGNYEVGSDNQPTSIGTQNLGVGFSPKSMLFASYGQTGQSGAVAYETGNSLSLGAAESATERSALWAGDQDNVATTNASQANNDTKALRMLSPNGASPTVDAEADYDSAGVLDWTDVDATAREFLWAAFGAATAEQIIALGLATESDLSLALSSAKLQTAGLSAESDQSLAASILRTATVGLATETEEALAISRLKEQLIGLSEENDQGLVIVPLRTIGIGLSSESGSALAVSSAKLQSVGLSLESDSSLALTLAAATLVGLAEETDIALSAGSKKARSIVQATETDQAFSTGLDKAGVVGLASETDQALSVAKAKAKAVAQAIGAEQALLVTPERVFSLGLSTEVDVALSISGTKDMLVGLAQETDTAFVVAVVGEAIKLIALTLKTRDTTLTMIDRDTNLTLKSRT